MKINLYGEPKVIISNPSSHHNYFGWPSIARLQNGRIAVVCSGFRLEHVCPFGKAVISYSDDNGETYSAPAPVIDTVLDDRDAGITPFGESGVIVTSFNNTRAFQRSCSPDNTYITSYLDSVSDEEEKEALGSEFRISFDNGTTFGKIYKSPVTSPHGPLCLKNGSVIWIGRVFSEYNSFYKGEQGVKCLKINPDGSLEHIGKIPDIDGVQACEPHTVELDDGTLVCHIRADNDFSTYQSISEDGGKTWSVPEQILPPHGGAPAHLIPHSSGVLISVYGYREKPYGIRAMFSTDGGKTWDTDNIICKNDVSSDLGYPATIELDDGTLLTVFYAHPDKDSPAVIMQQKWSIK